MTRYNKDGAGNYMVGGKKYQILEGSRAQVWHGTALKTSGGLQKHHLHMNKHGRVVSKKKFETARKEKRLVKAGFGTVKGKFGFVKLHGSKKMRGSKKGSKKMRGGYSSPYGALDAAPFGDGQQPSGVDSAPYNLNTTRSRVGGKRTRRRH